MMGERPAACLFRCRACGHDEVRCWDSTRKRCECGHTLWERPDYPPGGPVKPELKEELVRLRAETPGRRAALHVCIGCGQRDTTARSQLCVVCQRPPGTGFARRECRTGVRVGYSPYREDDE